MSSHSESEESESEWSDSSIEEDALSLVSLLLTSDSEEDDDALSLAGSLNEPQASPMRKRQPLPPPEAPAAHDVRKTNKLVLAGLLGASNASHVPGAPRERLLLCGAGGVCCLGRETGDAPRFIPAGVASSSGRTGAPVQAAACGPNGLLVLAHDATTRKGRGLISIWHAPALGMQTPSCIASFHCDTPLKGGAGSLGFAGGPGAHYVWVAERERAGASVHAYDWRARAQKEASGGSGGPSVVWVPGGCGRRLACVSSDGGWRDIIACGASFLSFLSLTPTTDGKEFADVIWPVHGTDSYDDLDAGIGPMIKSTWEPTADWDSNCSPEPGRPRTTDGHARGDDLDTRQSRAARACMPDPTGEARVGGDASAVRVRVHRARFSSHVEPDSLRPLRCLAPEPVVGGADAQILVGAADGCVLRVGRGRRVAASWHAHEGAVSGVSFAGGGTTYAATAGTDGNVRLWALSEVDSQKCASLVGSWDMRHAGLIGDPGPRVCLYAAASRVDPAAFELILLSGYGLHAISVDRPNFTTGRTVAASRCLLQGHRRAPHLLLAHPTSQHVLTVDEHQACVWSLPPTASGAAAANDSPAPIEWAPALSITLPVNEGSAMSVAFSGVGDRWAVGFSSGRVLLVDEDDGDGREGASVRRTLLEPPAVQTDAYADAVSVSGIGVQCLAFNYASDLLAVGCAEGMLCAYELPRTPAQQRSRLIALSIRASVPEPLPHGAPLPEPVTLRSSACVLPLSARRITAMIWSVSSAHIFAVGPAGTVVAAALDGNFHMRHVDEMAVGGAEWPKALHEATSNATALSDGGELLCARFHPMRHGQRLPRGATIAPPTGRAMQEHLARPNRLHPRSRRPRPLKERLHAAQTGGGVAAVDGMLGRVAVHGGLELSGQKQAEQRVQPRPGVAATSVVAHVAWTVGERFALTGDSEQPCMCVWRRQ